MAVISSGQITIIDMYDAPVLNAWISASQTTSQTYNNTTEVYNPNYATSGQVLTLNLTKAGSATTLISSQVKGVKWIKREGTDSTEITSTNKDDAEFKSGTSNSVLTTKANVTTAHNATLWSVEGIWTDPGTGLEIPFSASINLILVQLAKASVVATLSAPDGDFFRNNTPSSLKVKCDIYKDGSLSGGSRKYKWFIADPDAPLDDTDAGSGWVKITKTSGTTGVFANSGFDVAVTFQGVLTVYPDAVVNGQTFMVVVTDDSGGNAGTKMKQYITLKDMDDPIMVIVESTGGTVLKNGAGATTLKARLLQNGKEIDDGDGGTAYTYTWYKWENNESVNFKGGAASKTGKTLSVGSEEVNSTATFIVEVTK